MLNEHNQPPDAMGTDEVPEACRDMTARQRRFAEEYAVDLSRAKAAQRAGVSLATASEFLNMQSVRDYIQHLMDERAARTAIDADYVLTTIQDTIERCREAKPILKLNKQTGEWEETGTYKFDSAAVLKGCELLGRHLVLFTDKTEVRQEVSVSEIDEKLALLMKKYAP